VLVVRFEFVVGRLTMRTTLVLTLALALGACATASNYPPVPVAGHPDTVAFKVYVLRDVPESHADRVITPEIEAYRDAHGYRSYEIVGRRWNSIPAYFEYVARFR
jgi:hypothetical protein